VDAALALPYYPEFRPGGIANKYRTNSEQATGASDTPIVGGATVVIRGESCPVRRSVVSGRMDIVELERHDANTQEGDGAQAVQALSIFR
jgi:hypothetical protein